MTLINLTKFINYKKKFDLRQKFITDHNINLHNDKPTYHKINVHSRIDHIYSNCVGKINNLTTIDNGLSDHSLIKFNYNTKFNHLKPKFMYKHDKHLLTTHTLTQYIDHNDRLNDIFSIEDPDQIANLLLS